ncbi:MAG: AN1-type zinc finger domain-containing protein [Candidatus Hodarchaeales archaeon]
MKEERISLILSVFLVFSLVISTILLKHNAAEFLILGFGMSITSASLIYIFIIRPINLQRNKNLFGMIDLFKSRGNKSKKVVKKTKLFGSCDFCGKEVQFGFTCSYCGNYFCPDHRLPERHLCPKLK